MNLLMSFLLILAMGYSVQAIECFSCQDLNFDGESTTKENCFIPDAATRSENCTNTTSTSINYCRSQFTIIDGVVTKVVRDCGDTATDEDANSAIVPDADKCITQLSSANPISSTECYTHCKTDKCNDKTTASLKKCSSSCNINVGGGSCDYISGICVCNTGFSGNDCRIKNSIAKRRCVQCSDINSTACGTASTSVACPSGQTYCSTTTTVILDSSDGIVGNPMVTRCCTDDFKAVDECKFTDIFSDSPINSGGRYKEFTCLSTCNTDGCNTNKADGIVNGNEAIGLQCVVCNDTTGSGSCNTATNRKKCPASSTHCISTVTYLISNRTDLSYAAEPNYALRSVVRDCATAAVKTGCTESAIGTISAKKITCTETCQGDGCNTGWPARPECSQCTTSINNYGYDQCLQNPPIATHCRYPYQAHCTIRDMGREKGNTSSIGGYPRRITRGCSYFDIGSNCSSQTVSGMKVGSCNRTCTTDGCNVGFAAASGSSVITQNAINVIALAILACMGQIYI